MQNYIENDQEFNLVKMEKETIKKAFKICTNANLDFISNALGISTKTLYRKIKQYDFNLNELRK